MSIASTRGAKGLQLPKLIATFLGGQALVQAVSMVLGFAILHWLTKEEYAKYGLANIFQGAVTILAELGFAGSVVALVGARITEHDVVTRYINSARRLRTRSALIMVPLSLVAFFLLTKNRDWSAPDKFLLWTGIASGVILNGWTVYRAPLLMHRKVKTVAADDFANATFRLIMSTALYFGKALNGWTASWAGSLGAAVAGSLYKWHSKPYRHDHNDSDTESLKEVVKFVGPLWPGMMFTVFQAQIGIGLLAVFGTTTAMADLSALGRLAQLLTVFGAANTALVEPAIARSPKDRLASRCFLVLGLACGPATVLFLVGAFVPAVSLLLLGSKYNNVVGEFPIAYAGPCVSYVASVVYAINTVRGWIGWKQASLQISFVVVTQLLFILVKLPKTTHLVLVFGFVSSLAALFIALCVMVRGIITSRRQEQNG